MMVRRDGYLKRQSAEVREEDNLVSVERTTSKKSCDRLVRLFGVCAQEAKMPGRMGCGKPKAVNLVVIAS